MALKRFAREFDGRPPVTIRVVDWADEEGARFGRSLLGSSAVAGTLDADDVRDLLDAEGTRLQDALAACDVELDGAGAASARLDGAIVPDPASIIACPEGSYADLYILALTNSASYVVATDGLTITLNEGGKLVYEPSPPPA